MPITIVCEKCNKTLRIPDSLAGKSAKCPNCENQLQIPANEVTPSEPPAKKVTLSSALQNKCPECGTPLIAGQPNCPKCKYNIKLRRKLSLNSAIEDAAREPGIHADGTRYETNRERAESLGKQSRLLQKWVPRIIFGAVLSVLVILVLLVNYSANRPYSLAEIRKMVDKARTFDYSWDRVPSKYDDWHPAMAGLPVQYDIGSDQIEFHNVSETFSLPEAFAERYLLPVIKQRWIPLTVKDKPTFTKPLEASSYRLSDPKKWQGDLFIWRQYMDKSGEGYLRGGMIDFIEPSDRERFVKLLGNKNQKYRLTFTGTIQFFPIEARSFKGSDFSYAHSLINGYDFVSSVDSDYNAAILNDKQHKNKIFFVPILLIASNGMQEN